MFPVPIEALQCGDAGEPVGTADVTGALSAWPVPIEADQSRVAFVCFARKAVSSPARVKSLRSTIWSLFSFNNSKCCSETATGALFVVTTYCAKTTSCSAVGYNHNFETSPVCETSALTARAALANRGCVFRARSVVGLRNPGSLAKAPAVPRIKATEAAAIEAVLVLMMILRDYSVYMHISGHYQLTHSATQFEIRWSRRARAARGGCARLRRYRSWLQTPAGLWTTAQMPFSGAVHRLQRARIRVGARHPHWGG
jgi:hypothetical protein